MISDAAVVVGAIALTAIILLSIYFRFKSKDRAHVKKISCPHCEKTVAAHVVHCPYCGNEVRKCVVCGAYLPRNAAKCGVCGEKIGKDYGRKYLCPKCHSQVDPHARECNKCGEKFWSPIHMTK